MNNSGEWAPLDTVIALASEGLEHLPDNAPAALRGDVAIRLLTASIARGLPADVSLLPFLRGVIDAAIEETQDEQLAAKKTIGEGVRFVWGDRATAQDVAALRAALETLVREGGAIGSGGFSAGPDSALVALG